MISKLKHIINGVKPERFFLLTATIFGLLFVIVIPPFNNPDEPVHFYRAYQISGLHFVGDKIKNNMGGSIPVSLVKSVQDNLYVNGKQIYTVPTNKYPLSQIYRTLKYPLNTKDVKSQIFTTVAYSPTSYIPQSLAVGVGRILNASPVMLMYIARLAGLIAYVVIIFFAIRLIPFRKWAIAIIALLPMSLVGASAVTVDSSLLASLALFVSIILYLRWGNAKLTKKLGSALFVAAIILGLSKQIYILAIPLVLLIPNGAFVDRKARKIYIALLMSLVFMLAAIWEYLNLQFAQNFSYSNGGANGGAQLALLLHHPLHLINLLFNTFLGTQSDGLYLMFGGIFGWIDTRVPLWVCILVFLITAFTLIFGYQKDNNKSNDAKANISLLSLAVLLFAATCASLYIYWSPVGSSYIVGLQSRYFIPIIFLLGLLSFRNRPLVKEYDYKKLLLFSVPIVLVASTITIIGRYFTIR